MFRNKSKDSHWTELVTAGADCNSICLVFNTYMYGIWHKNQTLTVASAPTATGPVFKRRLWIFLGQCGRSHWWHLSCDLSFGVPLSGSMISYTPASSSISKWYMATGLFQQRCINTLTMYTICSQSYYKFWTLLYSKRKNRNKVMTL